MVKKSVLALFLLGANFSLAQRRGPAPPASTLFQQHCATCHGNLTVDRAAGRPRLRRMTTEAIYGALSRGVMRLQAKDLTDQEKRQIAEELTGRKLDRNLAADAKAKSNLCVDNPPIGLSGKTEWNGWGPDLKNSRVQS